MSPHPARRNLLCLQTLIPIISRSSTTLITLGGFTDRPLAERQHVGVPPCWHNCLYLPFVTPSWQSWACWAQGMLGPGHMACGLQPMLALCCATGLSCVILCDGPMLGQWPLEGPCRGVYTVDPRLGDRYGMVRCGPWYSVVWKGPWYEERVRVTVWRGWRAGGPD